MTTRGCLRPPKGVYWLRPRGRKIRGAELQEPNHSGVARLTEEHPEEQREQLKCARQFEEAARERSGREIRTDQDAVESPGKEGEGELPVDRKREKALEENTSQTSFESPCF